jgi:hypothetical protein
MSTIQYLSQNGMNKVFEQFVTADPNISSYGFGQMFNQNGEPKQSQRYPGMWVNPTRTDVPNNNYVVNRSYQIAIYDVLASDRSNENSIMSDCEEYAFRLIRFLRNKSDVFNVAGVPVITPFGDKFLDDVSGVIVDIVIEFNGEVSDCEDPDYNFDIKFNDI